MPTKPLTALTPTDSMGVAVSGSEIDAYIQALHPLGPAAMTAGQIDGLLAAVLTAPTPIETEEWLASIWIIEEGEPEPDIDPDSPEVAGAIAVVLDRREQIALEIEAGDYAPLFDASLDGDVVWQTWADGFMVGMTLDMDGWGERLQSRSPVAEAARLMVTLIDVSRDDPAALKELGAKTVAHFREHAPDLLTECVLELAQPDEPLMPVVRGPKIGRNDPCPCGSGKKHKKCCGVV